MTYLWLWIRKTIGDTKGNVLNNKGRDKMLGNMNFKNILISKLRKKKDPRWNIPNNCVSHSGIKEHMRLFSNLRQNKFLFFIQFSSSSNLKSTYSDKCSQIIFNFVRPKMVFNIFIIKLSVFNSKFWKNDFPKFRNRKQMDHDNHCGYHDPFVPGSNIWENNFGYSIEYPKYWSFPNLGIRNKWIMITTVVIMIHLYQIPTFGKVITDTR